MKSVRRLLLYTIYLCAASRAASVPGAALKLNLRTRVEAFKGSGDWQEVHFEKTLPVARTAIVICDMWDKHWCSGATRRVDALAGRMAPVVDAARPQQAVDLGAIIGNGVFGRDVECRDLARPGLVKFVRRIAAAVRIVDRQRGIGER